MKIQKIVVGELEENCYLLVIDGQALLIDPGSEFDKICQEIGELKLLKILVTHNHFDHIGCCQEMMDTYQVSSWSFSNLEETSYTIGPFNFEVLFTPGHSRDSVSYYFPKEKIMFVGDFVFAGTIGRCDLPTGDFQEMKKSIEKLCRYSRNLSLYPGHGKMTTLAREMQSNPYF